MRILVVIPLFIALLLTPGAVARAGWPDYAPSEIIVTPGAFVMTPSGSGESLQDQGVAIELWLRDYIRGVLVDFPRQDLWLETPSVVGLTWCSGGRIADSNTDAEGHTSFRRALAGGGWSEAGLTVYAAGEAIAQTPFGGDTLMDLRVNSPDINGDLVVDLSDIALFGNDLVSYHFRADYDHDGQVNLTDIALFAGWIGDRCP